MISSPDCQVRQPRLHSVPAEQGPTKACEGDRAVLRAAAEVAQGEGEEGERSEDAEAQAAQGPARDDQRAAAQEED